MEVDAQDVHDLCPEAKALSILKMSRKPENKDDMFHVRFDAHINDENKVNHVSNEEKDIDFRFQERDLEWCHNSRVHKSQLEFQIDQ